MALSDAIAPARTSLLHGDNGSLVTRAIPPVKALALVAWLTVNDGVDSTVMVRRWLRPGCLVSTLGHRNHKGKSWIDGEEENDKRGGRRRT
ncbi:hypothetical protein F2Q69_00044407 [Brassica cretica]|uniref:Uncharacterized protein n=1 Tax=Brassica cretica TaxID=69181 RepID=A0A8S9NCJ5_BRACR|nr:hypothetical protein F2Q69_00044407 [Brassica cretica]